MNLNIDLSVVKENPINEDTTVETSTVETSTKEPSTNSLALNLEEVAEIEAEDQLFSDFEIEESTIDNLVAAIGAGFAAESVFNARITEGTRAMQKVVVRQGKLTKKTICPEDFKVAGNGTCQRMSSADIIAFKRRAKKAAMTRVRP